MARAAVTKSKGGGDGEREVEKGAVSTGPSVTFG